MFQVRGSLKRITAKIETKAIAPEVETGWAMLSGHLDKANPYKIKAIPYKNRPAQKGQFVKASGIALKEGYFLGGMVAYLIRTLAEALAIIPNIMINHFN